MPSVVERHGRLMDALALAPRGVAGSQGHFSLGGWRRDVHSGIAHLRSLPQISDIWLLGFGTGGALVADAAAKDGDIAGLVTVAAPADFTDWASRPRELLSHARTTGAIDDPAFPPDFGRWVRELEQTSAVSAAEKLGDGSRMLVVHGSADDAVPPLDARLIADAHGAAELRIIDGARHHLRHDPRAMAIVVGWFGRRGVAPSPASLTPRP